MKVTRVCCQGCGADLQVSEDVRFVTCNFCGSKLEIVHDETVTHSKLLEKIGRQTDEMADDLKVIRLQNELEQLDREWAMQREPLLRSGRHGESPRRPSAVGGVIGGIAAIFFGVFWLSQASRIGAPAPFALFGVLFIVAALFGVIRATSAATRYSGLESRFQRRRNELERELQEAKRER